LPFGDGSSAFKAATVLRDIDGVSLAPHLTLGRIDKKHKCEPDGTTF
jgi:hypothetical protein